MTRIRITAIGAAVLLAVGFGGWLARGYAERTIPGLHWWQREPKEVPYTPGMTLLPGQHAIVGWSKPIEEDAR